MSSQHFRQEFERLRSALKRREQRRQNIIFAEIVDTAPHAQFGYIVAKLVDGTPVNVQAWTNAALQVGLRIMIAPISEQLWNWYTLIAVNGSLTSDVSGGTPYTSPTLAEGSLTSSSTDLSTHTGTLPWSQIDTSLSKVDLTTTVTGVLPLANQQPQLWVADFSTSVSINPGATVTGSFAGCKLGLVSSLQLSGGTAATLRLMRGAVAEYATTAAVALPFTDPFTWVHEATTPDFAYELTNNGSGIATFSLALRAIVLGS